MSVPSASPENDDRKKVKFKGSTIWISLSFLLSASLFAWAFTLPFRKPSQPLSSSALADRIGQRQDSADEVRAFARELDEVFMKEVAKHGQRKSVPGITEAKQHWSERSLAIKIQVAQWKDAEEGSLEWMEREKLLAIFEDGPQ